ncbi:MAG: hypothetical protein RLZZ481_1818 [Pseudomonadota bacterium]|jgi:hypothetical protein
MLKRILICLILLASPLTVSPTQAAENVVAIPQVSEGWRGSISPYIWLTNVSGNAYYDQTRLGSVDYSSRDLIANLNFAGMLTAEVHNGKVGALGDWVFSRIHQQKSEIMGSSSFTSKTTVEQGIYTLAATYTAYNTNDVYVDGLLGVRVMNKFVKTDINATDGAVLAGKSQTRSITTPIVGMKGRMRISNSDYFVPFYLDVGGLQDDVEVTTQQMIGIGHAYEWGDVTIAVKNLYMRQKTDGITINQSLFGIAAGFTFRF